MPAQSRQARQNLVLAIIAQNPGITDAHLLRRLGRRYRAHALALHTSTLVMRRQIRAVRDGLNLRYWPVTS